MGTKEPIMGTSVEYKIWDEEGNVTRELQEHMRNRWMELYYNMWEPDSSELIRLDIEDVL